MRVWDFSTGRFTGIETEDIDWITFEDDDND
jgi:hypothetical protein